MVQGRTLLKDVPTGMNLNQYACSGSLIHWHSDNEHHVRPTEVALAHCQLEFRKF